jgi:16S rRNA C967 or C1407 C5-methylase (RsmB/RsmF family)
VPSPEALATVPGLTAAQQADVRKALTERRDALEALRDKTRGEMQAMHKRLRAEREHIDEVNADKLRKQLGEEGYQHYAAWQAEHHRGHGPMGRRMHGMTRGGRRGADADATGPDAPMADFAALPPDDEQFDEAGMPGDEGQG